MATANPATPAPLGNFRNPYEFLRAPDVEEARQLAELKKAGTLTHQAVENLRQARRSALSLAAANHRECIRALAWNILRTRHAPPMDMQSDFLAIKHGCCTVLSLVSLIAAEVTANDYPHDLPFHPDALELADAMRRNHLAALQIVKDRIRTGALPVRAVSGIPVGCNDDPAVLAWCNDLEAVTPPRALCTTLADARDLVQAIGLNPLRELASESAPPTEQAPEMPAELEAPKRKGARRKTGRMTEAKKAIREILRIAGPELGKGAAASVVFNAIRGGEVPAPFQMWEAPDESGEKVVWWTDTKKKEHALPREKVREYANEAWDELFPTPR